MTDNTPAGRVADPGLQPERTSLSWQRTSLSIAVGALLFARIIARRGDLIGLGLGAAGIVAAVCLAWASHRRYRTVHRSLTGRADVRGRARVPIDGRLPLLLALTLAAGGLSALGWLWRTLLA